MINSFFFVTQINHENDAAEFNNKIKWEIF